MRSKGAGVLTTLLRYPIEHLGRGLRLRFSKVGSIAARRYGGLRNRPCEEEKIDDRFKSALTDPCCSECSLDNAGLVAWRSRASAVQKRGRVQPLDAVGLKRSLPGQKFLFRHLIAVTHLLKGDHAAGHCHYNRGFATRHPPRSVWGRQLEHRLDLSH
jgi:hypothetical protein